MNIGSTSRKRKGVSDDDTERIVQAALEEEQEERRLKAGGHRLLRAGEYLSESDDEGEDRGRNNGGAVTGGSDSDEDGRPVGEVEAESQEDGPIRESMVDVAQKRRADYRKGNKEDTGLVVNIENAEEVFEARKEEMEKEHGIELEAFNLIEERKRGYFDKDGNYIEKTEDENDEEEEADAWVASGEVQDVVDDATRKKIEERIKKQATEPAKELTAVDVARLQYHISKILNAPDETVAAALKRLAGPSRRIGKKGSHDKVATGGSNSTSHFNLLTEYASILMDSGETDVYMRDKSYFQRAASVYIDVDEGSGVTKDILSGLGPSDTRTVDDASEDMFADDSDAEDNAGEKQTGKVDADKEKREKLREKFRQWPIKELKRFCEENGASCQGVTDKVDLIDLAIETESSLSQNVERASLAAHGAAFNYHESTGAYVSADGRYYWTGSDWVPK
jgi:hypothetical protein